MKIKDYNDAITFFRTNDYKAADGAWSEFYHSEVLEPRITDQALLQDDVVPGPLRDELLKDFDPSQETYEEYLQRKNLGERPFNMAEGGPLVKPSVDGSRPGYAQSKIDIIPFDASKVNLTEYEKKLIRDEFPELEFKFNKKRPIGITAYKNHMNYKRVVDFIKRDFKTTVAFEPLSLSAQREIMREFTLPKGMKWNFKKYRYGISDGRAKGKGKYGGPQRIHEGTIHKGDRKLVRRIAKFVNDPTKGETRYWGRVQTPGGFMIGSVDRAVLQGNKNYELKIIDGRVAGFIDKSIIDETTGKPTEFLYKGHGEKRLKEGQKLITSHPQFKKIEKFYDITKDATKSLDDTSRVFQKLFEGKGFDTSKIRFTDLVRFLGDETSKWQIENSVVKHHKKGVKSSPLLAKDLQIVTQVNNQYADDMTKKIRKKTITADDLADIKRRGVRFQVDGKWYGVETGTTPEAQFKKVVRSSISDVKKWDTKKFNKFQTYLKALCSKGKASGGRIGFATGTPTVECGRKALEKGLATGKWESPEKAKLAKKILQTAGKSGLAGKIGSRIAAELFGPIALASIPVFEAGIAGYDTVTAGTPFKEAVNKTLLHYMAGDKWKADPEKLKRKDILNMADGPEKEMLIKLWSNMGNLERLSNLYEKQYNLEQDKDFAEAVDIGGYGDAGLSVTGIDNQIKDVENQIQKAGGEEAWYNLSESVMDPSAIGLYESKEGELDAIRKADSWDSRMFGTEDPYYFSSNYTGEVDPDKIEAMKERGPAYGMWSPAGEDYEKLSPEYIEFLNEYYKSQGIIPEDGDVSEYGYEDSGKSILEEEQIANKWKQLMSKPGMLGTQETFAGGGIVSLKTKW